MRLTVTVLTFLCCSFQGEPWLPGAWGDQQEHAGTHPAHVRWRPAADLHAHAKRLIPPLHELPSLQKPAQHSVRAVPWILGWWWSVIFQLSLTPPPHLRFILTNLLNPFFSYVQCRITWTGPWAWPLPGISALVWSAPDRRHSGLKISRGLDITSTATDQHSKTLQRNINTFCFCFLSFDRNNLFYLCSEFFMVRCFFCMIVWGEWFLP